jgi:hypothetical protein
MTINPLLITIMLRKAVFEDEMKQKLSTMPEQTQATWIIKEIDSDNLLPSFKMFLNIAGKKFVVKSRSWRNPQDHIKILPIDMVRDKIASIRESCPHLNFNLEVKPINPKSKDYFEGLCKEQSHRKPSR